MKNWFKLFNSDHFYTFAQQRSVGLFEASFWEDEKIVWEREAWQKYFALKQEICEKEEYREKSRYERREKIISWLAAWVNCAGEPWWWLFMWSSRWIIDGDSLTFSNVTFFSRGWTRQKIWIYFNSKKASRSFYWVKCRK